MEFLGIIIVHGGIVLVALYELFFRAQGSRVAVDDIEISLS